MSDEFKEFDIPITIEKRVKEGNTLLPLRQSIGEGTHEGHNLDISRAVGSAVIYMKIDSDLYRINLMNIADSIITMNIVFEEEN